jgi:hypothetical protein
MPEPRYHPLTVVAFLMSVCLLIGLVSVAVGLHTRTWPGLLDWALRDVAYIAAAVLLSTFVEVSTRRHPEKWKPRFLMKPTWGILALAGVLDVGIIAYAKLHPLMPVPAELAPAVDGPVPGAAYISVLFPLLFVGMICAIQMSLSVTGGWYRLGKNYPALKPPSGERFFGLSGSVGMTHYGHCLRAYCSPDGLYLSVFWPFRLGHPPLFIPWDAIREPRPGGFLRRGWIVFDVGSPMIATIALPKKVFADHDFGASGASPPGGNG